MKALVTGGNGYIGSHICKALIENKIKVSIFTQENTPLDNLKGLDVNVFYGDLRDESSVDNAVSKADIIVHTAALHTHWLPDYKIMYDVNVTGTENVLKSALKHKVKKFIYTSTQNVVGTDADGNVSEEHDLPGWEKTSHYTRSKYLAEKKVMEYHKKGLFTVILNPSGPIGAGDIHPVTMGKLILDFINRKYPYYFDSWFNVIAVEDVAMAHYLAIKNGHNGERYLIGNKDFTTEEFYILLEKISGVKRPRLKLNYYFILALAYASEIVSKLITKKKPFVAVDRIKGKNRVRRLNNSKSLKELKLKLTPIEDAIKKTIEYYKKNSS